MKRNKVSLLFLTSLLLLTGCSSKGEIAYQGEKWAKSLQNEMTEVLGEYLPYIDLGDGYKHQVIQSPSNDPTVYIYQESATDDSFCKSYDAIIKKTNYTFVKNDTNGLYYNYYKDLGNDTSIKLRFGFYPGDENENIGPAFEIYAYKETPVVEITSWTKEEEAIIKQSLGELFPCPHFTNKHRVYWDNELEAITVVDYSMSTAQYQEYIERITREGYVPNGDIETSFSTYDKPTQNDPSYLISIIPYNHNVLGAVGVEIYVKRIKDVKQTTSWPTEDINRRFNNDDDIKNIPHYTAEGNYYSTFKDGIYTIKIYRQTKENLLTYLNLLVENNYSLGYNSQLQTYVVINSKKTVSLLITHTSDFQKITIEISKL